jgi:hypothetical protein
MEIKAKQLKRSEKGRTVNEERLIPKNKLNKENL